MPRPPPHKHIFLVGALQVQRLCKQPCHSNPGRRRPACSQLQKGQLGACRLHDSGDMPQGLRNQIPEQEQLRELQERLGCAQQRASPSKLSSACDQ